MNMATRNLYSSGEPDESVLVTHKLWEMTPPLPPVTLQKWELLVGTASQNQRGRLSPSLILVHTPGCVPSPSLSSSFSFASPCPQVGVESHLKSQQWLVTCSGKWAISQALETMSSQSFLRFFGSRTFKEQHQHNYWDGVCVKHSLQRQYWTYNGQKVGTGISIGARPSAPWERDPICLVFYHLAAGRVPDSQQVCKA